MRRGTNIRRGRTLTIVGIATASVLVVGFGAYGLLRGPGDARGTHSTPASALSVPADREPKQLTTGSDSEHFAREVAAHLFDWDAATGSVPADYIQRLVDATAPDDAPALASDARSYFPDAAAWVSLEQTQTSQWITVEAVAVPRAWSTAEEQALPGQLPPGAIGYTIDGVRHRAGLWNGQRVTDTRPVSFTIFIACPTTEPCRLLRLSAVDQPLR